jgi:hypothetical protein
MRRRAQRGSLARALGALLLSAVLVPQGGLFAGGPLSVGGPSFGLSGVPFVWDNTAAIAYRVDGGPLSQKPNGGAVVINNAAGVARVQGLWGNWSAVPTANLSFTNAGAILPVGTFTGGDVKTAQDFLAVAGWTGGGAAPDAQSCLGGGQSPIVFDADGTIFDQLGLPPEVIGFAFPCAANPTTGKLTAAGAVLNGRFQDTIDNPWSGNYELTAAEFDQAFTHEFGHFLGLDHSQINESVLNGTPLHCSTDDNAGLPLMFPVLFCQARTSVSLPILSTDDTAWISRLYPAATSSGGKTAFTAAYGTISGTVYFSDGVTPAQGVNVIARQVDKATTTINEARRYAVSVVSGYLFTGNPGQTVTCQNPAAPTPQTCANLGSSFGSHDPAQIGYFEIPVPPGNYTVEVESVLADFQGGSGVGPLDPPIPAPGTAVVSAALSVSAGAMVVQNITLTGTPQRFDAFESAALQAPDPFVAWLRREEWLAEKKRA